MSLQSDLNYNPIPYVIYYCNSPSGQNDPTLYDYQGLSNVCSWGYDGSSDFIILSWLIGGYVAPSTATLLTYTLTDVTNFMNNFYVIPAAIAANEPYLISTTDLANIRADSTMLNYVVYDTSAQIPKYFNGTTWETNTSRYLHSTGGALSGNLDMSTNNILNVGSINSTISIVSNNVGINGLSAGSGTGILFIANASVVPSTTPSGGGVLYVSAGSLHYLGSSGTDTVLGSA